MLDDPPHKSHAGRWIIGVVIAVLLYIGSADPIGVLYWRGKLPDKLASPLSSFYKPANILLDLSPFEAVHKEWCDLWMKIIPKRIGEPLELDPLF